MRHLAEKIKNPPSARKAPYKIGENESVYSRDVLSFLRFLLDYVRGNLIENSRRIGYYVIYNLV